MNGRSNDPTISLSYEEEIALKFHLLGQSARLQILLAIGAGEACVCHLEACLGFRQAYISQQLMLFRDAGMVQTRRVGKHIFYSLTDPNTLEIIRLAGFPDPGKYQTTEIVYAACACPRCQPTNSVDEEENASEEGE